MSMNTPGRHLRIIALTASAFEADRQQCLEFGMDAFVAKPFDCDVLYRAVEEGSRQE